MADPIHTIGYSRKLTLTRNPNSAIKFKVTALSPRINLNNYPCICHVKDYKAVAVIGGENRRAEASSDVELYHIEIDQWTLLPKLQ